MKKVVAVVMAVAVILGVGFVAKSSVESNFAGDPGGVVRPIKG